MKKLTFCAVQTVDIVALPDVITLLFSTFVSAVHKFPGSVRVIVLIGL
jgi:hypothetical protein